MNKKRVIGIITIIIIILLVLFIRKFCIISKIIKNIEANNEITNYRIDWMDNYNMCRFITDGKIVAYSKDSRHSNDTIYWYMKNDGTHTAYKFNLDNKTYEEIKGCNYEFTNRLTYNLYTDMSLKDKILAVFTWKVNTEKIDGEKCYHVRTDVNKVEPGDEYEFWLTKENCYKIKSTTKEDVKGGYSEGNIYYNVTVNTVKEEDILLPDITQFKKVSNVLMGTDYNENDLNNPNEGETNLANPTEE